ncbi:hypothetical protein [Nonomuraea bangladeshensis]|uniref:hypothetical protein n=1 Tax=Nonomuraea bangladeshensis TaxID=404385 RepID=UPI0031E27A86
MIPTVWVTVTIAAGRLPPSSTPPNASAVAMPTAATVPAPATAAVALGESSATS